MRVSSAPTRPPLLAWLRYLPRSLRAGTPPPRSHGGSPPAAEQRLFADLTSALSDDPSGETNLPEEWRQMVAEIHYTGWMLPKVLVKIDVGLVVGLLCG